jgi:hypothetical protein
LPSTGPKTSVVSALEEVLRARKALLNGSGSLSYFRKRGISDETVKQANVGYVAKVYFPRKQGRGYTGSAFTYPCISGGKLLLGIHYKSEGRNEEGKRYQKWGKFADDLPSKGRGKKPDSPAKVIPFGIETLKGLEPGSRVILCGGEEDSLSMRQVGYTALSQPGAGLLEPAYATELAGFEVVVFYDAGEEAAARKDASKLQLAGAADVWVVQWPADASHGADINGRLIEDPEGFEGWVADMIDSAKPLSTDLKPVVREGMPETYAPLVLPVPETLPWPTLRPEALYGLPGEIARAIEPDTEADPAALLVNFLAAFGNAIGRGAHALVGADEHHVKLFVGLVGESAKGRKGVSWGPVRALMETVDPGWVSNRVVSGLSSGEGLIHAVRDEVIGVKKGEEVVLDPGEPDKRLMAVEGELAGILKIMSRDGNTLSPTIRQAWDGGRLRTLTKNSPTKSTDAHISIIGHITKAELLRHLSETEAANGFANRFLWVMVRRSKELPFGGDVPETTALRERLDSAIRFGRTPRIIRWGESARGPWAEVYGPLSEGKPGMFGAVTGRVEAQTLRLATLYAVMDESETIEYEHLAAALAL